jgi:hypothetical protein
MSAEELGSKKDRAGEGRQQITQPDSGFSAMGILLENCGLW